MFSVLPRISELQDRKALYFAGAAAVAVGLFQVAGKSRPACQFPLNTAVFGFVTGATGAFAIQNARQYLNESKKLAEHNKASDPKTDKPDLDKKLDADALKALEASQAISKKLALASAFLFTVVGLSQVSHVKAHLPANLRFDLPKAGVAALAGTLTTLGLVKVYNYFTTPKAEGNKPKPKPEPKKNDPQDPSNSGSVRKSHSGNDLPSQDD